MITTFPAHRNTRVPRTLPPITESDIEAAEQRANDATATAEIHPLTCVKCIDKLACIDYHRIDAEDFRRHTIWESLVRERIREQGRLLRAGEGV